MVKTSDKIILAVLVILLVGIGSVFITAFTSSNNAEKSNIDQNSAKQLTADEAKAIAISESASMDIGVVTDVELETESGTRVYSVEFTKGSVETDIKIDAKTGDILKVESDLDDGSDDIGDDEDDSEDDDADEETVERTTGMISEQEAIDIAKAQVNMAVVGQMTDVELENEDGTTVYAVEFTKNGIETDVKLNAKTGVVIEVESDEDEEDDD